MNEEIEQKTSSFYKGLVTGLGIAIVITLLVLGGISLNKDIKNFSNKNIGSSSQHTEIVNNDSIKKLKLLEETINKHFWQEVETEKMEEGMYKGLLDSLDDPYSVYYTVEELENLRQQTEGIYYGIGAYIGKNEEMGYCEITRIIENTPAEESKLMAGDVIVEIDGEDMQGKDNTYVVSKIKGDAGTYVTLTIYRSGESDYLKIDVERRKIESPTVT